jgi:hypothetical protein
MFHIAKHHSKSKLHLVSESYFELLDFHQRRLGGKGLPRSENGGFQTFDSAHDGEDLKPTPDNCDLCGYPHLTISTLCPNRATKTITIRRMIDAVESWSDSLQHKQTLLNLLKFHLRRLIDETKASKAVEQGSQARQSA